MAGERILAIEDNPLNAKLVRDALNAFGYEVSEATTAEEGLERARSSARKALKRHPLATVAWLGHGSAAEGAGRRPGTAEPPATVVAAAAAATPADEPEDGAV